MNRQFTTTVVGSLPRPPFLIKAFKDHSIGLISKKRLDYYIEKSIESVIKSQESIGLDVLSDGEQARTSFVNFIGDKIEGVKPTHITKLNPDALKILKTHNTLLPYIRAVPREHLPDNVDLIGDELSRIKRYTKKPIKLTLPSPYLLMWETWHNIYTRPYYNEPEDLGYQYVKIIRNEIKRLRRNGADIIQIDEPMLGNLLEANGEPDRYRKIFGLINGQKYRGFNEELQLCKDMMNETVKGISGIEMHICHWPNSDSPNYGVGVERFIPDLFDINVDNLVMEYKTLGSGDPIHVVKEYPDKLKLTMGVLDVRDHNVEKPDDIVKQVQRITKYIEPNRICLCPDCGFAPGMTHPFPRETAFKKIESMVKASHILRDMYG
jgi:5-methyltetrahydropteroyltriglutamate--homocysteine methyltransferase